MSVKCPGCPVELLSQYWVPRPAIADCCTFVGGLVGSAPVCDVGGVVAGCSAVGISTETVLAVARALNASHTTCIGCPGACPVPAPGWAGMCDPGDGLQVPWPIAIQISLLLLTVAVALYSA